MVRNAVSGDLTALGWGGGAVSVELGIVVAVMVVGVVLTAAPVVIALRGPVPEREWPAVLPGVTPAARRRRRAAIQVRRGRVVAPHDVTAVRAVAVQFAGQRGLAVVCAGAAVVLTAQVLLPFLPTVVRVAIAVLAAGFVVAALAYAHNACCGRRFLAAHPDPEVAVVGR